MVLDLRGGVIDKCGPSSSTSLVLPLLFIIPPVPNFRLSPPRRGGAKLPGRLCFGKAGVRGLALSYPRCTCTVSLKMGRYGAWWYHVLTQLDSLTISLG